MEVITLQELAARMTQAGAAKLLGCNQTNISQALRNRRVIAVTLYDDGTAAAVEFSVFPQTKKLADHE
ncbi:TPA: hypothetical protein OMS29_004261 [Klebsiella aerogenes]|nr:hypothetical protein [Klebsiella aerogenes]